MPPSALQVKEGLGCDGHVMDSKVLTSWVLHTSQAVDGPQGCAVHRDAKGSSLCESWMRVGVGQQVGCWCEGSTAWTTICGHKIEVVR